MVDLESIPIWSGTFRCGLWTHAIEDINLPEYKKLMKLLFRGAQTARDEAVNEASIGRLQTWFPHRLAQARTALEAASEDDHPAAKRRYDKIKKRHDIFFQEVNKYGHHH